MDADEREWRSARLKMKRKVEAYIKKYYGERCGAYEPGCALCHAWICFDYLFTDKLAFDGKKSQWYYPKKVRK
jgi:hypothetical protein